MTIAPSTAAATADNLLASLDPEQRAAAELPDGPALIIAPAGSGKTTTLAARANRLYPLRQMRCHYRRDTERMTRSRCHAGGLGWTRCEPIRTVPSGRQIGRITEGGAIA